MLTASKGKTNNKNHNFLRTHQPSNLKQGWTGHSKEKWATVILTESPMANAK
jgi:hypothetical protein